MVNSNCKGSNIFSKIKKIIQDFNNQETFENTEKIR